MRGTELESLECLGTFPILFGWALRGLRGGGGGYIAFRPTACVSRRKPQGDGDVDSKKAVARVRGRGFDARAVDRTGAGTGRRAAAGARLLQLRSKSRQMRERRDQRRVVLLLFQWSGPDLAVQETEHRIQLCPSSCPVQRVLPSPLMRDKVGGSMDRRVVSVVALVILVASLFYWVAWRSQVIRAPGEPPRREVVEEAQRIQSDLQRARELYAQLDMMPVREVSSIEQLDETLGAQIAADMPPFVSDGKPGHDAKSLERIRHDVIGLMYHRWFAPSFDDYDRFMVESGYVLPETYAEISDGRRHALRLSFEARTGEPFDPSKPPRESLRRMWESGPAGAGRAVELGALSIDPDGVEVATRTVCPSHYFEVELEGALGRVGWHGAEQASIPRYWQPSVGWLTERLESNQCVELATVGVILQFNKGDTVPYRFNFWYDVQTQRWYLYSVGIANFEEGFGGVFF